MTNNKYKILLVEDDENIRTVITAMLEASDYQVVIAETCALAKMLFSSHQPACRQTKQRRCPKYLQTSPFLIDNRRQYGDQK